ncbi:MAG: peptidylprolyl isomerase [Acetivibrio sp.]
MNKKKNIWSFVLLVFILFTLLVCGYLFMTDSVVLKVNGSSIHKDEIMYYIYLEEQKDSIEKNKNPKTIKKEALENAIYHEIFYQAGKKAGFVLEKEQETQMEKDEVEVINALTKEQKKRMHLSKERLKEIKKKAAMAELYSEEIKSGIPMDISMITSSILEEDYVGYKVEYVCVPVMNFDKRGEQVPYTKKRKKEARNKMDHFLFAAKGGKEFSELVEHEDRESEYGEVLFLKGDELFGSNFEKAALQLSNGEITSKVVEEEDGYYIIRMQDRHSLEGYWEVKEKAVEEARQKAIEERYKKMKNESKIVLKKKIWKPILNGGYLGE